MEREDVGSDCTERIERIGVEIEPDYLPVVPHRSFRSGLASFVSHQGVP